MRRTILPKIIFEPEAHVYTKEEQVKTVVGCKNAARCEDMMSYLQKQSK